MWQFSFVSLSLLVVVHSKKEVKLICPDGWTWGSTLCYKVFEEKKTWNEAEEFCRAQKHRRCHPAAILNSSEKADLAQHLSKNFPNIGNIWIGLSQTAGTGAVCTISNTLPGLKESPTTWTRDIIVVSSWPKQVISTGIIVLVISGVLSSASVYGPHVRFDNIWGCSLFLSYALFSDL